MQKPAVVKLARVPYVAALAKLCGPTRSVIEIGSLWTPQLERGLRGTAIVCFDAKADQIEQNQNFVWQRTKVMLRTIGYTLADNQWPLDHFWDYFLAPVDLIICHVPDFCSVILGGLNTFRETKRAIFRTTASRDRWLLSQMLPDWTEAGKLRHYMVYINNSPTLVKELSA